MAESDQKDEIKEVGALAPISCRLLHDGTTFKNGEVFALHWNQHAPAADYEMLGEEGWEYMKGGTLPPAFADAQAKVKAEEDAKEKERLDALAKQREAAEAKAKVQKTPEPKPEPEKAKP